jgi:hypothetical protein
MTGRVRRVVHQGLGADRDLVAEDGGDLVRMTGAADVPEQPHPVGRIPYLFVELGSVADPGCEQARPKLRLQRLSEGVVLRKSQCGDELSQTE